MRPIIIGVLWVVSVLGAVALYGAGRAAATAAGGPAFANVFLGLAIDVVAYASVGALLMLRRPGNVIGVALGAAALLFVVTFLGFIIGAQLTIERGMDDAVAGAVGVLGGLGIYPTLIVAGPLLALLFPDGRPPGPMFRRTLQVVAGVLIVLSPLTVIRPSPSGDSLAVSPFGIKGVPWLETATAISDVVLGWSVPAMMLLAVVGVIVRFRRAPGVERQQLKWFVAAVVLVAAGLTLSTLDGVSDPTTFDLFAVASLSLIPLAIGVAILRYRLYEIDRIISRTIGWALVTALLVAVFAGVVVALQTVLAGITQGETLAVAASTLVAFALFQPVRRRVQSAVDRRFDRARYDAQRTVDTFAEHLRSEVDLGRLRSALVVTADRAVRPVGAAIWLRAGSEG
jgi:hypothetical protein